MLKVIISRRTSLLLLCAILLFNGFGCVLQKPEITPQQLVEHNNITKEADALYHRGSYTCLKQAYNLYEEALTFPVFQSQNREKLLKTAILLGIREKELGILEETYLQRASGIIASSPSLSNFEVYLKIASTVLRQTAGVVGDAVEDVDRVIVTMDDLKNNLQDWATLLQKKAETEPFYAYLSIAFHSSFSYLIKEKLKVELDISPIKELYADSNLIRYKLSLYPKENPESLEKLLQEEYSLYEAFYFLGHMALKKGHLVSAEKNFLKAYEYIPESSSLVISLASIYFAFEELDKSLEFYERAIEMAPNYRDALLGKAMCLSYLGKPQEAIKICHTILALGKYYMGEAHYWLAWNQNELGELENAWKNIEASKKYLIGHGQVHFLAGIIAFSQKNLDVAEINFLEACYQDASDGDPLYYMGKIKSIREDWLKSGVYFERSSGNYGRKEELIQKKINDIESSEFSEERKHKHIIRKKNQLRKIQLTKATAWYNAAAGYYNAGMKKKALELAQKATSHSALKSKAEELLELIKK